MNQQEYQQYQSFQDPELTPIITREDLERTSIGHAEELQILCYGYTLDRCSFYVLWHPDRGIGLYIDSQRLVRTGGNRATQWDAAASHAQWRDRWLASELSPSKRAYPQHTDLAFARVLRYKGRALPFTTPDWQE